MDYFWNEAADPPDMRNDGKGKEDNGRPQVPRKDDPSPELVFSECIANGLKASPKAHQLKYLIDNINVADPDRQHPLIKAAVTCYLNDKKLEQTNGGTVANQKQVMGTLSMTGDTVSSRVNSNPSPPFDLRDSDSDDSHENDVETGNGETCNKRGGASRNGIAFRPLDGMETCHSNVADAMDSVGPGVIAKRTQSAPQGSFIPQGCIEPTIPLIGKAGTAEMLRINPNIKPADAAKAVRERFSNPPHPLLGRPGIFDAIIMKQTQDHVRKEKKHLTRLKTSPTVGRAEYFDDIARYIAHHRINYDRLKQIGWEATLRSGPEWIHETARTLQREKVFASLGCNEHRPETHLVVLDSDEVLPNERWQTLHQASDKVHMTGPDTRGRTVVFSSIALLANSDWCENMSWEVCGSVDGTHGISDSSYKLITLGVNAFCEEKVRRSFHPLVYIWGEGEREIVALHGFLNWKIAVRHLFGIKTVCFKRGVVSDSTSVISNSVKNAGPMWLQAEAEQAIRRCSVCKTEQQMLKMWELTLKKWVMDGEEALAETFAKTYTNNNDFNTWNCTASGQHGCIPCNNSMESHHHQMKGSKNFYGYMELSEDMYTCLTNSFVRLVYKASVSLSSPSWGLPVLDYGRASLNNDFMKFQSLLNPKVDIKEYNDGWLINDVTYLATLITEDDIAKMDMALSGKMEEDAGAHVGDRDIRDILLSRTTRFQHVKRSVWTFAKNNDVYFHCDCRDYYYSQWCFQSAYMQHREKLQLSGQKITSQWSKSSNSRKRRRIIKDALKAAEERIDAQNIKNGN
ncbi:hypothetical protein IV203_035814 [Nitzschia inconspicua]|uniref:Uncharacterized protein n=1 Tax=Nitzschia inconspicua TaxID=303405 RepID=A0A9K3PUX9_9STRA|nr:hypothetical protein IV203_035814 [Nitzschia inconspicua]